MNKTEKILNECLLGVHKDMMKKHFDFKPAVLEAMHTFHKSEIKGELIKFADYLNEKYSFDESYKGLDGEMQYPSMINDVQDYLTLLKSIENE